MKSPFPGMDPYLESRWLDVHSHLNTKSSDVLNQRLPPGLLARSEERAIVAVDDRDEREINPDVSIFERGLAEPSWDSNDSSVAVADSVCVVMKKPKIKQRYLEIRDARSGGRVVTVIEFVSPTNKRPGDGLTMYCQKQNECRSAGVNLVEIDLTRAGDRSLIMPIRRLSRPDRTTYQAWISRGDDTVHGWAFRLPLTQRLPAIPIPLRPSDRDVLLELQPLIDQIYDNGRYDEDIDYSEPLEPPLAAEEAEWVASILAKHPKPIRG
ncbi:MAG: DUF4058 family protein [Planctomycetaceae bacterium]